MLGDGSVGGVAIGEDAKRDVTKRDNQKDNKPAKQEQDKSCNS